MATAKKKTSKKAATKTATTKKAASKKTAGKKSNGEISMAEFMNRVAATGKSADQMVKALQAEAKRRGLDPKTYTLARLRGHVKFRQSKGQLKGITIPKEVKS